MIQSQVRLPRSTAGSQSPTWKNVGNILTDDGVLAVSPPVLHQGIAPYLKLSDFGFAIPLDATVKGVVVRVEGKNQYAYNTGFHCTGVSAGTGSGGLRLLGTVGAVGRSMTAFTANTLATKIVGGDSDLWQALEITPEQVNSNEFGLYAAFKNGSSLVNNGTSAQTMSLDKIELEVFFDDNQPEPPIGGNGPVKPPAP